MLRRKKKKLFMFEEPENTACIACKHVVEESAPILHVTHDEDDGMWQFMCGAESHETEDGMVITLMNAVRLDPTINDLYEMPMGVGAERECKGSQWEAFKL